MRKIYLDASNSFTNNFALYSLKELENSVTAGNQHYVVALSQILQLSYAIEQYMRLSKGSSLDKWQSRAILYIVPLALSQIVQIKNLPPTALKVIYWFHTHIGSFAHLTNIVTTIALFVIGQRTYGFFAIATMAYSFASRNNYFPKSIQNRLDIPIKILAASATMISGDLFFRLFTSIDLICEIMNKTILAKHYANAANHSLFLKAEPIKITENEVENLNYDNLRVNTYLFEHKEMPDVPFEKIEIADLLKIFDGIDWEKALKDEKMFLLEEDIHYRKFDEKPSILMRFFQSILIYLKLIEEKKEEALVGMKAKRFLRSNLQKFIQRVEKKEILAGKISDYDALIEYLQRIIYKLSCDDASNASKEDILFYLAKDGLMCGPRILSDTEEFHDSIYALSKEESPKRKIFSLLHRRTKSAFQKLYSHIFNFSIVRYIYQLFGLDPEKMHTYNLISQRMGEHLKLRNISAENDEIVNRTEFEKTLFLFLQKGFDEIMEDLYSPDAIIDHVRYNLGMPQMPKTTFYPWFDAWFSRQIRQGPMKQILVTMKKLKLEKNLLVHKTEEIFLEKSKYKLTQDYTERLVFQKKYIIAMLIEMGVLAINESDP